MNDQVDDSTETTNISPPESVVVAKPTPEPLDPYLLFKQIDSLRQEGVPEETIREAFNQFMEERQGNFRKPQVTLKKTANSIPMPSQEDINKMYEGFTKNRVLDPAVELLLEEIENAWERKQQVKRISFRQLKNRVARYFFIQMLRVVIWCFSKIGVE